VLGATVETMRAMGERDIGAVVGPTIGPECYEFGPAELDPLVRRFGPAVASRTAWGTDALDMVALVRAALAEHGVPVVGTGPCTACDDRYWSHRARQERGRQVMALWREPA
jgi:copper oxidase (laccase) domain-containing protein